jgi:hypothetical protein
MPAMDQDAIDRAAGYLAEAFETGNPLAPLPDGLAPRDIRLAQEVAGALLDRLGLVPCGLRLAPGPGGGLLAGPVLEARLLRDGAAFAVTALRHARLSAAAIGVLGEPLAPGSTAPPVLAAVMPALDIAQSRFRDGPADDAACVADLCALGHIVAGRRRPPPAGAIAAACGPGVVRARGTAVDLPAAFAAAAAAARDLGGLPAGALLVVAGLAGTGAAPAEGAWTARLGGGLGAVRARLVPGAGGP